MARQPRRWCDACRGWDSAAYLKANRAVGQAKAAITRRALKLAMQSREGVGGAE